MHVLLERAAEFLELCAQELDRSPDPTRWDQVRREVEHRGTYTHTLQELEVGARVAWRNSTRCIGRLHTPSLVVRDHRGLHGAEEIFGALVDHLRFATNGGRIRSTLSVFPPRDPESGESPLIWNGKLVRYAGYPDGTGDPDEHEFTDICRSLGWQPPGGEPGPFDLLPVVIQAAGDEEPRWFELPGEEVLEVEIRHPRLAFFREMGIRWYAVPVITDMVLEMGGIEYPCAPFNGWFMGTEIGARNLSDPHRYDLLPEVAQGMGLDPGDRSGLWRDRALVELNEAVLHSFRADGVTIVDHHTASRQWEAFTAREGRAGRPVHGDWSWLVPPLSGSASSLFHQEMENRVLSPNFYYRDAPWRAAEQAEEPSPGAGCPFHIRSRRVGHPSHPDPAGVSVVG
ncbi:MAG: nitric oxide synthase oxygenase [Gemmatimonadales bacterium]|nr:MAG: nitric oxide synthase oxygenase [Gemmatimonadales bacterium]